MPEQVSHEIQLLNGRRRRRFLLQMTSGRQGHRQRSKEGVSALLYEDQEYHRRRAEKELDNAVAAEAMESAVAHLELARMHRARRTVLAQQGAAEVRQRPGAPIFRADKEA